MHIFYPLSLVLLLTTASTVLGNLPNNLYSPLVASKILVTATSRPSNTQYPQNTDTYGKTWQYTGTDYWTSGFFPATLYAMNDRRSLCRKTKDNTNWIELARRWSAALTSLEGKNTVGHDVGFISFPFVNELAMCVCPSSSSFIVLLKRDIFHSAAIPSIRPRSMQSTDSRLT
jgi:hypothetical protein